MKQDYFNVNFSGVDWFMLSDVRSPAGFDAAAVRSMVGNGDPESRSHPVGDLGRHNLPHD